MSDPLHLGALLVKAERERDDARTDRDAALALLREIAQTAQQKAGDAVIVHIPRMVWAEIDALLEKERL